MRTSWALQLVVYEDVEILRHLLASLETQTDRDWELWITDCSVSASVQAACDRLREIWKDRVPTRWVDRVGNDGFDGGHQRLYASHDAPVVMLLNPDLVLAPDAIERLRAVMDARPDVGSAGPIVYRWVQDGESIRWTPDVDSAGLVLHPWQACADVHQEPSGMEPHEVFGVSGCCAVVRRQAVQKATPDGRLFDPRFFMYKEDVNLAYRLRRARWKSVCVPAARAAHRRTFRSDTRRGVPAQERYSYRNHLWNLLTQVSRKDWIRYGWVIVPYEVAKAFYFLCRRPSVVRFALADTWAARSYLRAQHIAYAKRS